MSLISLLSQLMHAVTGLTFKGHHRLFAILVLGVVVIGFVAYLAATFGIL